MPKLDNQNSTLAMEFYVSASRYLSRITCIEITAEHTREMLTRYPETCKRLADEGCVIDTAVCDELADVAAHFFAGRNWPTYSDKEDIHSFLKLVQSCAKLKGYRIVKSL